MKKIIINFITPYNLSKDQFLELIKEIGFDGVFVTYANKKDADEYIKACKRANVYIDSIHAPYQNIDSFYSTNYELADSVFQNVIDSIECAYINKIKYVIIHPYIGFEKQYPITDKSLDYFKRIVKYAKERNIIICFENLEGEIYLHTLMKLFEKEDNVKLCLDTGHEMCYNIGKDIVKGYEDRFGYIHINDNMGCTSDHIYFTDDYHLIPGDGILDINNLIKRLNKLSYRGNLVFELKPQQPFYTPKNEEYKNMGAYEFYKKAYQYGLYIKEKIN